MILGMSLAVFTTVHVIISLVAIASGIAVVIGLLGSRRMPTWTALFLVMTVLTSLTGFLFPVRGFTPALGTGVYSMIVLAIALVALYVKGLAGAWRWIYIVTAIAALQANILVLIVQSFEKLSFLNPHAPQVGPPFAEPQNTQFAVAQGLAFAVLVFAGIVVLFRFVR
jgi:hypothetical protein